VFKYKYGVVSASLLPCAGCRPPLGRRWPGCVLCNAHPAVPFARVSQAVGHQVEIDAAHWIIWARAALRPRVCRYNATLSSGRAHTPLLARVEPGLGPAMLIAAHTGQSFVVYTILWKFRSWSSHADRPDQAEDSMSVEFHTAALATGARLGSCNGLTVLSPIIV
jgi:hypothetical protein